MQDCLAVDGLAAANEGEGECALLLLLLFVVVGVVEGGLRLWVAWSERLVVETSDGADGVVCGFVLEVLDFHAVDGFEEVVVDFPPEFCREGVQGWG